MDAEDSDPTAISLTDANNDDKSVRLDDLPSAPPVYSDGRTQSHNTIDSESADKVVPDKDDTMATTESHLPSSDQVSNKCYMVQYITMTLCNDSFLIYVQFSHTSPQLECCVKGGQR